MFLSLKTLYRKRTVIWPFTTQLYGLYHEIKEQFKVKYNLMNKIESSLRIGKYVCVKIFNQSLNL